MLFVIIFCCCHIQVGEPEAGYALSIRDFSDISVKKRLFGGFRESQKQTESLSDEKAEEALVQRLMVFLVYELSAHFKQVEREKKHLLVEEIEFQKKYGKENTGEASIGIAAADLIMTGSITEFSYDEKSFTDRELGMEFRKVIYYMSVVFRIICAADGRIVHTEDATVTIDSRWLKRNREPENQVDTLLIRQAARKVGEQTANFMREQRNRGLSPCYDPSQERMK